MSLLGLFKGQGPSGFGYNSTSDEVSEGLDLTGKTYLLTGANAGLGRDTLRVLCLRGARVLAAARTQAKAEAVCAEIEGDARPVACELSDPASVRAAVATVTELGFPLDGIINNAGIMALPKRTLVHGYELQFFTNHVGHFMLVTGLLDQLSEDGRVVVLSSGAHSGSYKEGIRLDDLSADTGYSSWGAYGQSKLANLLFARELSKRLPKPGQTANSVHPGVIATSLGRHMNTVVRAVFRSLGPPLALKSVPQGSATQVYLATHPDAAASRGLYFADCNPAQPSAHGRNDELAAALWARTEEIVAELP